MKKPVLRKGATIQVTARRWFDSHNGNTYHSVQVVCCNNGKETVLIENFKYGYDSHYLQTALGLVWATFEPCKGVRARFRLPWWWQLKDFYRLSESVTDVARKKDLAFS